MIALIQMLHYFILTLDPFSHIIAFKAIINLTKPTHYKVKFTTYTIYFWATWTIFPQICYIMTNIVHMCHDTTLARLYIIAIPTKLHFTRLAGDMITGFIWGVYVILNQYIFTWLIWAFSKYLLLFLNLLHFHLWFFLK